MAMETFSLLDDEKQSSMRTDLTLPELYKSRLLRIDLGPRSRTDPFQDWIHKGIRYFRYWRLSKKSQGDSVESFRSFVKTGVHRWSNQDSVFWATVLGRFTTALTTGVFLVVPLTVLSPSSSTIQLAVVAACTVSFSLLIATTLKISNFEIIALSAAYAAVISVFLSQIVPTQGLRFT